jgi:hypothetical protein
MSAKGLSRRNHAAVSASHFAESVVDHNNNHAMPVKLMMSSSSSSSPRSCLECYNYKAEQLEFDYSYDNPNKPQPYPRIRERGEYYVDSYNDQPWSWTFGTHESVREKEDIERRVMRGRRSSFSSRFNVLNACMNCSYI